MPYPLNQVLIDRLVCAKYIFRRSCELLDRGGPFSAGLAISGFQDSAESVLRVAVEHLNVSIKRDLAFSQILDAIDEKTSAKVPYRSALNQLNTARVSFKHFGLEPKEQDAKKLRKDLEAFFPLFSSQYLNLDFETISLISLVGYRRAENFLRKAEASVEQGDFRLAVDSCAIALALCRQRMRQSKRRINLDPFGRCKSPELRGLIDSIKTALEERDEILDILMDGIALSDFKTFRQLAPQVTFTMANTFILSRAFEREVDPNRENALFCLRFSLDSILTMKSAGFVENPPWFQPSASFQVARKSPIVVWPANDHSEYQEVICEVEVGTKLEGIYHRDGENIVVLVDGEAGYIRKDAVEELASPPPEQAT